METTIKKQAETLLKHTGVEAKVEVTKEEDGFNVAIDSQDNAILIGKHGNTLYALEVILSLMSAKDSGEYKRVTVEIGGYRKDREEYLTQLSTRLKDEVVTQGIEKTLRGLKSWERRFVHLLFKEDADVITESEGEGLDRVLLIKKK